MAYDEAIADRVRDALVAHDAYREHYLTFADAYGRNLAAARARDEIADGRDEPVPSTIEDAAVLDALKPVLKG